MLSATFLGVAAPLITFTLLTVVGSDLTRRDFQEVRRRPGLVIAGLVAPPLVLPLIAVALVAWLEPPLPIASGLLLIAICPVGGISNTFTYLARGSAALSVTLTTLSCLLAALTVPVLGALVGHVAPGLPVVHLPAGLLVAQVLASVVLPVALGMTVRMRWPRAADNHRAALQRIAFGLLAVLLAMIILSDPAAFAASLSSAVPLAVAFVVGAFAVGGGVGHVLGADIRARVALAIEFATRNVAVATTLAVTAGRVEFATFATTYFLTELPLMTCAALVFRVTVTGPRAAVPDLARVAEGANSATDGYGEG